MILRDLATAWVRANCPRSDVQEDFLQHLDRALQRDVTCSFSVGRDLTKSGKRFLIYCFHGELFAFELTMEQAGRLDVDDNMLVCAEGPPQRDHPPSSDPVVWLEEIAVDNATSLDRLQPITGTLQYRSEKPLLDPLAIRVVCEPPGRGRICLFHHLFGLLPPEGAVKFSLARLGEPHETAFTGALPLFFQIWSSAERNPFSTAGPRLPGLPGAPKPQQPRPISLISPTGWQPTSSSVIKPVAPASLLNSPQYDLGPKTPSPAQQERPVSDVRAVLVEII